MVLGHTSSTQGTQGCARYAGHARCAGPRRGRRLMEGKAKHPVGYWNRRHYDSACADQVYIKGEGGRRRGGEERRGEERRGEEGRGRKIADARWTSSIFLLTL